MLFALVLIIGSDVRVVRILIGINRRQFHLFPSLNATAHLYLLQTIHTNLDVVHIALLERSCSFASHLHRSNLVRCLMFIERTVGPIRESVCERNDIRLLRSNEQSGTDFHSLSHLFLVGRHVLVGSLRVGIVNPLILPHDIIAAIPQMWSVRTNNLSARSVRSDISHLSDGKRLLDVGNAILGIEHESAVFKFAACHSQFAVSERLHGDTRDSHLLCGT